MKKHLFYLFLLFASSASILAQCPSATNLILPYNQDNGQRGVMFDVEAINTITITCFDANLYDGTAPYEIYHKTGTHQGFQTNAAAWTLLGSVAALTGNGNNVPTNIPIPINVSISAGQTHAFYITNTSGGGLRYTNGTAYNVLASNADFTVFEGTGKSYPFGTNFVTRRFNGHIHYVQGVLLPVEYLYFKGEADNAYNKLHWATGTETESKYFEIERSADAISFEKIGEIKASGNSSEEKTYSFDDLRIYPLTYYRLKLTDNTGHNEYSDILAVEGSLSANIIVSPNPTDDKVNISAPYSGKFRLLDVLGRNLFELNLTAGETTQISLSGLPAGFYYLQDENSGKSIKLSKIR